MAANDQPIELVLLTGAGASVGLAHPGVTIPAMKDWSDQLTGALGARDPGVALLVHLHYGMEGIDFERQLGRFFASARAFRDARDLMLDTSHLTLNLPPPFNSLPRTGIEDWHTQATAKINQVSEVMHESLYKLFSRPQFDSPEARRWYLSVLDTLGIGPNGTNWVYATTNYDTVGEEALEEDFRVEWGDRHRRRLSEVTVDPETLLANVSTSLPVLHLHGCIGWYRRSADEGGQAIAVNSDTYQPGFGTPIVMLPDPNKVYDSDPVINSIWDQFNEALSRARRVLVLGHSLNDEQIVSALKRVDPDRLAVTAYGHASDPSKPESNADPILQIVDENLPGATIIPIRFGDDHAPGPVLLESWAAKFR